MKRSKRANEIMEILPPENPKRSHYMDTNKIIERIHPENTESQRKSIRRTLLNMKKSGLIESFTGYQRLQYHAKRTP